ncbi:hypothetical protein SprV_0702375600 [Sparganum proliferum]
MASEETAAASSDMNADGTTENTEKVTDTQTTVASEVPSDAPAPVEDGAVREVTDADADGGNDGGGGGEGEEGEEGAEGKPATETAPAPPPPPPLSKEETARLVLLKQQIDEMSPLYLPHEYKMLPDSFDPESFPRSYKENTDREIKLLLYADNFRRQYAYLYRDRTRLLLTPQNECGVRKFVCTTIRPTKLPYAELYDWNGAAAFVADFLDYVPLVPSTELPTRLLSPSTALTIQMGTCFEYTTILCSMLIGVGYDAYVVSGYATRECCYADESRKTCPMLVEEPPPPPKIEEKIIKKYQVKPIKDFNSRFELSMEVQKTLDDRKAAEEEAARAKAALIKKEEPLPDPLYGLRVHSWILVLPGRRDVTTPFFIEPLTGLGVDIKTKMYLGIESVWNNMNYWVNMQDCSNGIQEMRYNLHHLSDWEYMLPSGVLNELLMPHDTELVGITKQGLDISEKLKKFTTHLDYGFEPATDKDDDGKPGATGNGTTTMDTEPAAVKSKAGLYDKLLLVDLPLSWTLPIVLSKADYDMRYPNHTKMIVYNRAKLQKYSPYSQPNGLVSLLTIYEDRELQQPLETREGFAWRRDKLLERITDLGTSWVTEKFDHGRMSDQLKEHGYRSTATGPEAKRYMVFYEKVRVDGLMKRERVSNELKEWYCNRHDRLVYRETKYGRTVKKFGPPMTGGSGGSGGKVALLTSSHAAIDVITERFDRNPNVPADEDVAERVFNIAGNRYILTYHIADDKIFPCTREFIKPPSTNDRRQVVELHSDTHSTFQVDPNSKPKTNVAIYNMLLDLMALEEQAKETVRRSEKEVQAILSLRDSEEAKPKLDIGLFDTLRNKEMHDLRIALEEAAENERRRQKEKELDYLAPYLEMKDAILNDLTREQAFSVREACLQDLKERLIKKANIIQVRFEGEVQALQQKQQWFQLNQINLTKDDEQAYLQYCNDAIFRITTLETMLMRHKQTAPQKYMMLEKRLRSDPRLAEFLQNG